MRPFEIGARTLRRLDWFARGAGYWPGAGGLAGTDSARPIGNICCGILPGFGVVALILDHLVGQPLQHRSHAVSSTATPRSVGPGHRIAGRCGRCWGSEGQDHSRRCTRTSATLDLVGTPIACRLRCARAVSAARGARRRSGWWGGAGTPVARVHGRLFGPSAIDPLG
jgi:hypothetical protein